MIGIDPTNGPYALLFILGALVFATAIVGGTISDNGFGAYNPSWDGMSTLRGWIQNVGSDPHLVLESETYRTVPANESVTFVVTPSSVSDAETASLRRFLQRGGTVVVMDDRAARANPLLASLGAHARIDGTVLRDERYNHHSPSMPIATNDSDHALAAGVDGVTLNYGSAVRPHGATPLVSTSNFSYRDENGNGTLDGNEQMDSYPIATVENVGDGRVVVVGDPSIAINSMVSRPGNTRFVRNVLSAHDRALFDYTHTARPPPIALALLFVRRSLAIQLLLTSGLGVIAFLVRQPTTARRLTRLLRTRLLSADEREPSLLDRDEMVMAVEQRHPSWSRARIERIVAEVRSSERGEDDD